jgi:hypothetical protein
MKFIRLTSEIYGRRIYLNIEDISYIVDHNEDKSTIWLKNDNGQFHVQESTTRIMELISEVQK